MEALNTYKTEKTLAEQMNERLAEMKMTKAGDGSPKPDETKKDDDFKEYLITTTCDVLNIRSGAGTDNKVVGAIREVAGKKNKYTIVEEKNGWGRLKSGAGWISLSYTKKVAASTGTTFTPYLITTTCDVLNIRSGAGTGYSVVGAIRAPDGLQMAVQLAQTVKAVASKANYKTVLRRRFRMGKGAY